MDKEVAAVLLVIVAILGIFVSLQPLIPSTAEKFSELGLLGPNQTIANYPTNMKTGQSFLLYGYIGNHEGQVDYYRLLVKLGNASVQVTNSTSAPLPQVLSYARVLDNNQSWVFPINLALNTTGTNLKLIFELWKYNETTSNFGYTGLWDQLYLNVTS
jgi:uncharacterized membrane protein